MMFLGTSEQTHQPAFAVTERNVHIALRELATALPEGLSIPKLHHIMPSLAREGVASVKQSEPRDG